MWHTLEKCLELTFTCVIWVIDEETATSRFFFKEPIVENRLMLIFHCGNCCGGSAPEWWGSGPHYVAYFDLLFFFVCTSHPNTIRVSGKKNFFLKLLDLADLKKNSYLWCVLVDWISRHFQNWKPWGSFWIKKIIIINNFIFYSFI